MVVESMKMLSERCILIYAGEAVNEETFQNVQAIRRCLTEARMEVICEVTPSYTSVCVEYEPMDMKCIVQHYEGETISEKVMNYIAEVLQSGLVFEENESRIIEIPVRYGGEDGPDLDEVAAFHGLSSEEVIAIHTAPTYFVHMLGFAPGFPYLGGLDERLATPRKETPRLRIEAGSVGIAGGQTGIYPLASPGGWQIIGKTDVSLFDVNTNPPTLLQAGDRVRFKAVREDGEC